MLAKAILVYFQTLLIQLAQLLYSAAGVNLTCEIVILVICSMQKQKNVIFRTMWNVKLILQDWLKKIKKLWYWILDLLMVWNECLNLKLFATILTTHIGVKVCILLDLPITVVEFQAVFFAKSSFWSKYILNYNVKYIFLISVMWSCYSLKKKFSLLVSFFFVNVQFMSYLKCPACLFGVEYGNWHRTLDV